MCELIEKIKTRITECVKSGNVFESRTLKTLLGEIQTIQSRTGKMDDEGVIKVLKRFKQGVEDTKKSFIATDDMGGYPEQLDYEIAVYDKYIPVSLSVEDIIGELATVIDAIKTAKSSGQATGLAMGYLKKQGCSVDGKDVSAAVNGIRGQS